MAVYKLIQDIEAEDKLIGPLTLKGFIYALIAGVLAFINVKITIAGGPGLRFLVVFVLALPMILFGVLASPLGGEQPTEVWLLSRVRFLLKQHKRVWDQNSGEDNITVTAPPVIERHLTKDYTQKEVKSRLKTLAITLDSQGWALKDVNPQAADEYTAFTTNTDSQRLVSSTALPQSVSLDGTHPADDILDTENNSKAKEVQSLMLAKDEQQKAAIQKKMDAVRERTTGVELPLKKSSKPTQPAKSSSSAQTVTSVGQAGRLELAQSGNDLSVASIAKLANRQPRIQQVGPNEIVISLH